MAVRDGGADVLLESFAGLARVPRGRDCPSHCRATLFFLLSLREAGLRLALPFVGPIVPPVSSGGSSAAVRIIVLIVFVAAVGDGHPYLWRPIRRPRAPPLPLLLLSEAKGLVAGRRGETITDLSGRRRSEDRNFLIERLWGGSRVPTADGAVGRRPPNRPDAHRCRQPLGVALSNNFRAALVQPRRAVAVDAGVAAAHETRC